jgi:hypothetical protein
MVSEIDDAGGQLESFGQRVCPQGIKIEGRLLTGHRGDPTERFVFQLALLDNAGIIGDEWTDGLSHVRLHYFKKNGQ